MSPSALQMEDLAVTCPLVPNAQPCRPPPVPEAPIRRQSQTVRRTVCVRAQPHIRFLFIVPRFRLGGPKHPASRRRTCPLANLRLYIHLVSGLSPDWIRAMHGTHVGIHRRHRRPCGMTSSTSTHAAWAWNLTPIARATLSTVAKLGLPFSPRPLYKLSRLNPASRATCVIPLASVMSPGARAIPAASSGASSSQASRYAATSSGVRSCSATSYATVLVRDFTLAFGFDAALTLLTAPIYVSAQGRQILKLKARLESERSRSSSSGVVARRTGASERPA